MAEYESKLNQLYSDGRSSKIDQMRSDGSAAKSGGIAGRLAQNQMHENKRVERLARRAYRAAARGKDPSNYIKGIEMLNKLRDEGQSSGAGIKMAGADLIQPLDQALGTLDMERQQKEINARNEGAGGQDASEPSVFEKKSGLSPVDNGSMKILGEPATAQPGYRSDKPDSVENSSIKTIETLEERSQTRSNQRSDEYSRIIGDADKGVFNDVGEFSTSKERQKVGRQAELAKDLGVDLYDKSGNAKDYSTLVSDTEKSKNLSGRKELFADMQKSAEYLESPNARADFEARAKELGIPEKDLLRVSRKMYGDRMKEVAKTEYEQEMERQKEIAALTEKHKSKLSKPVYDSLKASTGL